MTTDIPAGMTIREWRAQRAASGSAAQQPPHVDVRRDRQQRIVPANLR
jgi:hypothetical protein